jgi:hypothetical protein
LVIVRQSAPARSVTLTAAAGIALLLLAVSCAADDTHASPDHLAAANPPGSPEQADVIAAPEPRFVAPTEHDKIGRIWAPVLINGKGPFRLALDTGATNSAVTADVARALGPILIRPGLRGAPAPPPCPRFRSTGWWSAISNCLHSGCQSSPARWVADGFSAPKAARQAHHHDFRNDSINIVRSHKERAGFGFVAIPFKLVEGLAVIDVQIGEVAAKAIVDTGGQGTIGNVALHESLLRRYRKDAVVPDGIIGITLDVQSGNRITIPPIVFGGVAIEHVKITTGEMEIFRLWKMTNKPVVLLGMDVLGLFDTLIIDYARRELQVRFARGS